MKKFLWVFALAFLVADLPGYLAQITVFSGLGSSTAEAAKQKKRYKERAGKKAPSCRDFPRPALCSGIKAKTDIYVVSQICDTLKAKPKCFATIGYRSCRTNSKIRGAARRSAHLCGKAVDIRLGTCNLGQFHGKGSAKHRHYEIGKCN